MRSSSVLLDSLNAVVDATTTASQREVLLRQGEMIVEGHKIGKDQNDLMTSCGTSIDGRKHRRAKSSERDVMSQRQQRHLLRRCPMIPAEPTT